MKAPSRHEITNCSWFPRPLLRSRYGLITNSETEQPCSQSVIINQQSTISHSAAFSLIEIVIAIGVASFCLIAMLGLIPSGLKSVNTSTSQTVASEALAAIADDLRNASALGTSTSPVYGIVVPAALNGTNGTNFFLSETGGKTNTNTSLNAQYGVNLVLSNASSFATTARIQVYWPPTTKLSPTTNTTQGFVETVITFSRN